MRPRRVTTRPLSAGATCSFARRPCRCSSAAGRDENLTNSPAPNTAPLGTRSPAGQRAMSPAGALRGPHAGGNPHDGSAKERHRRYRGRTAFGPRFNLSGHEVQSKTMLSHDKGLRVNNVFARLQSQASLTSCGLNALGISSEPMLQHGKRNESRLRARWSRTTSRYCSFR